MLRRKIVICVGAGASAEFGLPVGSSLKNIIRNKTNISWAEFGRQTSGDPMLVDTLRLLVRDASGAGDINPHCIAGRKIADAMPQALSIDNFLDAHRSDRLTNEIGKIAIALSILEAESACQLARVANRNRYEHRLFDIFDFGAVEYTWMGYLQKILFESVTIIELPAILKNLTFVTFNYDRCIEHFLVYAIANYYAVDFSLAAEIVNGIAIFHPYGAAGRLPWQNSSTLKVPFGPTLDAEMLLGVSRQLKTFTEGYSDTFAVDDVRRKVADAETVLFLGMAFHEKNLDMIRPQEATVYKEIYGTTFGLSPFNEEIVKRNLQELFGGIGLAPTNLHREFKAKDLIDQYSRVISS